MRQKKLGHFISLRAEGSAKKSGTYNVTNYFSDCVLMQERLSVMQRRIDWFTKEI